MSESQDTRDKLFDHEYDGIREYDNPMPGWWVWLFVASVVICFPYVLYYHSGNGPSVEDRYEGELAAFAEQLMATYGDLQPDDETILRFMGDDVAMAGMGSLFKAKCARCHQADGGGGVGPNLTDQHYLNVKSLTEIPTILVEGVIEKGMPAWGDQLSTTQIVLLTSYVARMRGTNVPGKAPQGDLIPPWPDAPAPAPEAPDPDDTQANAGG